MPHPHVKIQENLDDKKMTADIISASTLPPRNYDPEIWNPPTVISNNDSPLKQREYAHLRSRERQKFMNPAHPMSIDQAHPMSIDQARPMSIDPTMSGEPAHPMSITNRRSV